MANNLMEVADKPTLDSTKEVLETSYNLLKNYKPSSGTVTPPSSGGDEAVVIIPTELSPWYYNVRWGDVKTVDLNLNDESMKSELIDGPGRLINLWAVTDTAAGFPLYYTVVVDGEDICSVPGIVRSSFALKLYEKDGSDYLKIDTSTYDTTNNQLFKDPRVPLPNWAYFTESLEIKGFGSREVESQIVRISYQTPLTVEEWKVMKNG